jgi:type IV pilus assembly protein PilM
VRPLPIGLDIGTTAIRLLQLCGTPRDLRVQEAAKFTIPQDVKAEPQARRRFIVETLHGAVRRGRFRGREAVMALPPSGLAARNIRLPQMNAEELTAAVNWEAQNKFPFDTATAIIQFLRAGEVRQGDRTLDEIILLAAPRAEVEGVIQMVSEAGLSLVSLDAEPCAIFRGFERFLQRREDVDVVTALVDLGAQTRVIVARGRQIEFLKTIPLGGAALNRAVAECLDVPVVEAEGLRRRLSSRQDRDPEDTAADQVARTVADAIRSHLEDLANEIGLCLRYHSVTFRAARPETILFCGGEAHNPDLIASLGERLGIGARVGEPLRGVKTDHLGPILDRRHGGLSEWATAMGLSLKGFHLAELFAAGYAA